jgi:hypothetical protein
MYAVARFNLVFACGSKVLAFLLFVFRAREREKRTTIGREHTAFIWFIFRSQNENEPQVIRALLPQAEQLLNR